ncbi:Gfo/Idh/MocA family protein [Halomarina oriensis]|uniref:Gfo/Idh/MocA family oxidoreductase n=1 Tax=Halomarina oriensis TaxID=671145 RepID=A0A6B0GM71_9EURY|nr:Gfo/Idh/MocA family oxidoreductase [Halomarina oriensis]MWG35824.1 gfo/Idh/MocA family oxidoreductase [Halomarina oriensis]
MGYRVAIIGTGADPNKKDRTGYAMAYRHAPGYLRLDDCDLVACADIVPENARAFADHHDIAQTSVYEDYQEMLEEEDLDVVSVCVPAAYHADIVVGAAESGELQAIHCEKPMATTWADCKRMVETCERHNVQLTIDNQRRFGSPFRKAKELLDDGTVGDLVRVEWSEDNLFDAGVHTFDLCRYYTDDADVDWVLAGIDFSEENVWFGTHNENHGFSQWRYENGVYGLAATGDGMDMVGAYFRLVGESGVIEIGVDDGPALRYRRDGGKWKTVKTDDSIHGPAYSLPRAGARKVVQKLPVLSDRTFDKTTFYERAIEEVVTALDEEREPEISGRNALAGTELVYASWESSRRRGRVNLPIDIDDNPLDEMIEARNDDGDDREEAEAESTD